MSFNLYYAGGEQIEEDKLPENNCLGKLFTFALGEKALNKYLAKDTKFNLCCDSGAFGVAHSGKKIDIDNYIQFINNDDKATIYAALDVIPWPDLNVETVKRSSEESWNNYIYMMDRLNDDKRDKVMPTYHFGEPYEALERMLNTEVHGRVAPYIAFGGRFGSSTEAIDASYSHLFEIVKKSKNPNVKIHVFGMTVLPLLEKYPFYSADSTSYLQTAIYGSIYSDVIRHMGIIRLSEKAAKDKKSYYGQPLEVQKKIEEEVISNGYTIEQLAADGKARVTYNALYLAKWAINFNYEPQKLRKRRRLINV